MKQGEGFVLFCEDIRRDITGMNSLIGVFSNDVVFAKPFPNTMPKLGLMINIYVDVERPPSKIDILVLASWEEEGVAEFEIDMEEELGEQKNLNADNYLDKYPRDELTRFEGRARILTVYTVMPLFEVPEEGMLRVVADIGGEKFLLGRKLIRAVDEPASSDGEEYAEPSSAD